MSEKPTAVVTILISGIVASVTSSAMLAVASLFEGKRAAQPMNATSHWLRGPQAADANELTLSKTGVGFGTHLTATVFWAALFEFVMRQRAPGSRKPSDGLSRATAAALATSAVAAAVDYTVTPKRFTPGWEFILPKTAMALGYAAMSAGLVLGRRIASGVAG